MRGGLIGLMIVAFVVIVGANSLSIFFGNTLPGVLGLVLSLLYGAFILFIL